MKGLWLVCIGAVSWAQPAAVKPPAAVVQIAAQAAAAREAGRTAEAAKLYERAVAVAPKWAEGWWWLGSMAYAENRYAPCRDAMRRMVQLDATVSPAFAVLGLCEFQTKEFAPALKHLEQAFALGLPEGEDLMHVTLYHAALLHVKARNYERALLLGAYINRFKANDAKVLAVMGIAQLRKPLFPQEVAEGERELVMRLGQAFALQSERHMQDAIAAYEAVLAAYPETPNVRYAFGTVLMISQVERGVAMIESELKVKPDHVTALVTLAAYYLKMGDVARALPYAERAAQAGPEDFPARAIFGRVLVEKNEAARGVIELEAARQLAPESPEVRYSLALAYAKAGRETEAARERAEFSRLRKQTAPERTSR